MAAARPFVAVRVTDMVDVDLARYQFDYGLTFAVLFMHPDGHVHARYGGRETASAEGRLSMPSLLHAMRSVATAHAAYVKAPRPPAAAPRRTIRDSPWFARRTKGGKARCVHCHTIDDAVIEDARAAGTWRLERVWRFPDPARLGLTLAVDEPLRVTRVAPASAAERAGLRVGDQLTALGGTSLITEADLRFRLDRAPWGATKLPVRVRRGDADHALTLSLADGWKQGTPADLSWRPAMWRVGTPLGFGGRPLSAGQRRSQGLPTDGLVFRIGYVVTWGTQRHTGAAARRAGLRKGDVVVSVGGRRDFADLRELHAWVRLTRKAGDVLAVEALRGKRRFVAKVTLQARKPE